MAGKGVNKGNKIQLIPDDCESMRLVNYWEETLCAIYQSIFEWDNVPDTIDIPFMERQLCYNGLVFAFNEDAIDNIICLPAQTGGKLNAYGYPTRFNVWGLNGYTDNIEAEKGVYCYDNSTLTPPLYKIKLFAKRLAEIDLAIDVNTKNQKTPYIISTTENNLLTVKNMFRKAQNGETAIYSNKKAFDEGEKPFDATMLTAPYVSDKLQNSKLDIMSEFLNFCGIFSGAINKAERVTSGENAANIGLIRSARKSREKQRDLFCERMNRKFNLNMACHYSEENLELFASGVYKLEGGLNNGELYDNTQNDLRIIDGKDSTNNS